MVQKYSQVEKPLSKKLCQIILCKSKNKVIKL